MLERDLERACTRIATAAGWLGFKFVSPGRRGVPDRLYIREGAFLFVEYKTPRGRVTPAQERTIAALRAAGARVEIIRDTASARRLFES